ncbi:MAG: tetratricopeptide repeat protein [Desulfarculus sp.]|nr:tetratricopeptide repeat protein [Desulfarculus sp.]
MSRRYCLFPVLLAVLALTPLAGGQAASTPEGQAGGQRHCLRLLMLDSQAQAQELAERARSGEPFAALARRQGAEAQKASQMRCLAASELSQEVLAAIGEIEPGQVGRPLSLGGKWLLVQVTTDEHWRRGEELHQAGRHQEAKEALLRDAALNPDGPAWRLLARSRAAAKDQAGALQALDMALTWSPEDVALLNDKASLLQGLGRRDEALAQYETALALQPDNPVLQNNLAWMLVRQNQKLERAEALAGRATQLDPGRASYWDTLGLAQQARGNQAGAAASYHQALKLDPELAPAKANLLKCLLALDQATLARLLGQGPEPTAKAGPGAPQVPRRKAP